MTVSEKLDEFKDVFDLFDNSKDKYIQLIDMGRKSPELFPEEKNDINKIYGCTSQAWVVIGQYENGTYFFRTDSDAQIVKGLLSIISNICDGESLDAIHSIDGSEILNVVGLNGAISSQRINGFSLAMNKIKKDIVCLEMKKSD
jgi:cysteine desulfuration protein SufE|tara:strand:- start:3479 stop:3910 length:432 start_codon:yes stop_codon:yes gene_type:complete